MEVVRPKTKSKSRKKAKKKQGKQHGLNASLELWRTSSPNLYKPFSYLVSCTSMWPSTDPWLRCAAPRPDTEKRSSRDPEDGATVEAAVSSNKSPLGRWWLVMRRLRLLAAGGDENNAMLLL